MSLAFDSASSNTYVDYGSDSTIDDVDPCTIMFWCYTTGDSTLSRIFNKNTHYVSEQSVIGTKRPRAQWNRATTNLIVQGSDNDFVNNTWQFFAVTFDSSTGSPQIFMADLTSGITEPTYTTQQNGSGAITSDAAQNLGIGNDLTNLQNARGYKGYIAYYAIYNTKKTEAEVRALYRNPGMWKTSDCVFLTILGFNGTGTQPDYSGNGNSGTVTNATVADHVPLGLPFEI